MLHCHAIVLGTRITIFVLSCYSSLSNDTTTRRQVSLTDSFACPKMEIAVGV